MRIIAWTAPAALLLLSACVSVEHPPQRTEVVTPAPSATVVPPGSTVVAPPGGAAVVTRP